MAGRKNHNYNKQPYPQNNSRGHLENHSGNNYTQTRQEPVYSAYSLLRIIPLIINRTNEFQSSLVELNKLSKETNVNPQWHVIALNNG